MNTDQLLQMLAAAAAVRPDTGSIRYALANAYFDLTEHHFVVVFAVDGGGVNAAKVTPEDFSRFAPYLS